jgi:hypothetical protein
MKKIRVLIAAAVVATGVSVPLALTGAPGRPSPFAVASRTIPGLKWTSSTRINGRETEATGVAEVGTLTVHVTTTPRRQVVVIINALKLLNLPKAQRSAVLHADLRYVAEIVGWYGGSIGAFNEGAEFGQLYGIVAEYIFTYSFGFENIIGFRNAANFAVFSDVDQSSAVNTLMQTGKYAGNHLAFGVYGADILFVISA